MSNIPESPDSEGAGLLGLTEVEPSPVEDTPYETSKDGYFPPSNSPPPSTHSSTFGLGNHSPAYYRERKHSQQENSLEVLELVLTLPF